MRRAFTLIEILTVVAIIAIMVTASVVSVRSGQNAARVKSATRDIFATIRHARSVALITQQPSVITYSTGMVDGEVCAKVEIVTAKLLDDLSVNEATTLAGDVVRIGGEEVAAEEKKSETAAVADNGDGQSVADILFSPISSEVVKGLRLKVTKGSETLAGEEMSAEQRKSMISAWGTASGIIDSYRKSQEKLAAEKAAKEEESDAAGESAASENQEPVSIVWEVNGRTEPHRVWIYRDGSTPEKGLSIKVDRFGAAKVIGLGEDDE